MTDQLSASIDQLRLIVAALAEATDDNERRLHLAQLARHAEALVHKARCEDVRLGYEGRRVGQHT